MNPKQHRREFLADVGRGVLVAAVGPELAGDLGFAKAAIADEPRALSFGSMEPLVCLMQETPIEQLLPRLIEKMKAGYDLRQLTAAAALANARSFGGEDYVGFHTLMALSPAYHMSQELPVEQQALPVFKVLYRNTNRIREHGGRSEEVLRPVAPADATEKTDADTVRTAVRNKDLAEAERAFAQIARGSPEDAFNAALYTVQDATEVHRVVLPYRAWGLLEVTGRDQAHTLLRQSVRYCIKAESWKNAAVQENPRALLPKLLESHNLLEKSAGTKKADDAWISGMVETLFKATPEQAAEAAAAALAEGILPSDVGEAITLTANQLVLRDQGRSTREEVAGKPVGSVHGDSIGVHACDSANAWRNMARVANPRNSFASLILGAYQVALDRTARGGDFQNWQPLPVKYHVDSIKSVEASDLLKDAEEAIRGNLQARVSALVYRYGELGHPARPVFDLLLKFAISEDGALHAEKFYRTVSEEFASTRPAYRWRHLMALARVTASEYGRPAPGMAEARALLKT